MIATKVGDCNPIRLPEKILRAIQFRLLALPCWFPGGLFFQHLNKFFSMASPVEPASHRISVQADLCESLVVRALRKPFLEFNC